MKAPTTRSKPAQRRRALRRRWGRGGGCVWCSCGLLAFGAFSMQSNQRLAKLPSGLLALAAKQPGNVALPGLALGRDFGLRQTGSHEVLND